MQIIDHCNSKSVTWDWANLTFIMVIMETIVQETIALSLFLCAPCHSPNISGPVHTTLSPRNFKIQLSFWSVFEKNWVREITWLSWRHHFRNAPFSKCFSSIRNRTPGFFLNFSHLKSVFERLRFRDGLVSTAGQPVWIKLRFQIFPAYCEQGLRLTSSSRRGRWKGLHKENLLTVLMF